MILAALWTAPARAEDSHYVVGGVMTTALYKPVDGPVSGPLGDVSPTVGAGVLIAPTVALELDVSMTFDKGGYIATGVGPGVIWSFSPVAYLAGRLFVPVHPSVNLAVLPGVGLTKVFDSGLAPFLEVDAVSAIGTGHPDFGVAPSAGFSFLF